MDTRIQESPLEMREKLGGLIQKVLLGEMEKAKCIPAGFVKLGRG